MPNTPTIASATASVAPHADQLFLVDTPDGGAHRRGEPFGAP
jgi:hypothetical protein